MMGCRPYDDWTHEFRNLGPVAEIVRAYDDYNPFARLLSHLSVLIGQGRLRL